MEENYLIFNDELNLISDRIMKDIVIKHLKSCPDYFYRVPASSSGKYHPKQDLGECGTVRHTKTCIYIGLDLLKCEQFLPCDIPSITDNVIISLMIHDTFKCGTLENEHTVHEHPILASNHFRKTYQNYLNENEKDIDIQTKLKIKAKCECICDAVSSHMGKWVTNKYSSVELPSPKSNLDILVHLADYIASRKYINMYNINNEKIN